MINFLPINKDICNPEQGLLSWFSTKFSKLTLKELYRNQLGELDWNKFLLYFKAIGATAGDPLSEFCNDLEKAPDEVLIL